MIGWWFMHLLHANMYVESADVKIVLGTLNVVPDWMLLKNMGDLFRWKSHF